MQPHFISLFGVEITTYGLMVAIAFMVLWGCTVYRGRKLNYPPDFIQNLLTLIVITAMVGARALYVIVYWEYFREHPAEIIFSREGYVFVGGLIGAVGASALYIKWCGQSALGVADLFAPYVALAHAIGRLGCFLYGCCYGGICSLPWAVRFPKDSPAYVSHYEQGLIRLTDSYSLAIHPTQLYEMLINLGIFAALIGLRTVQSFRGQLAMGYLIAYGIGRFIVEIYRADPRGAWAGLSTSQWISFAMVAGGIIGLIWLWKKNIPPETALHESSNPETGSEAN